MPTTFWGDAMSYVPTRRPTVSRVTRPANMPTPPLWLFLTNGCWQVRPTLAWESFQALVACRYTDVVAFREKLVEEWPTVDVDMDTFRHELDQRGITAQEVMRVLELAVLDQRLTIKEANELEACVLSHVDHEGGWK
jgi:hypothetical protein